jgi:hypothetical protein
VGLGIDLADLGPSRLIQILSGISPSRSVTITDGLSLIVIQRTPGIFSRAAVLFASKILHTFIFTCATEPL